MPKVSPPKYPVELTVKHWNKAKGVLARMSKKKTGITDELKKVEKDFNAIKWDDLQITKFVEKKTSGQKVLPAKQAKQILKDYLEAYQPTFKKLEKDYGNLSTFLTKKSQDFAKEKSTKSCAKDVQKMAEAANKFTYAVAWGTVSADNQKYMMDVIKKSAEADKKMADSVKGLKEIVNGAVKAAVAAAKSKTLTGETYERPFWSQNLRGVGAQIKLALPHIGSDTAKKLMVPLKIAATLWNDNNLPSDKDVPGRIKKDIELLAKFKAIVDKL